MVVHYNEPITFGCTGTARQLKCSGIDFDEDTSQSWTCGPVAELDFSLPFTEQGLSLEIEASPFVVPDLKPVQKIFVFLGGMFAGYSAWVAHAVKTFQVDRRAMTSETTPLTLVIPSAVSPTSLGIGEDYRELGICLSSITFKTDGAERRSSARSRTRRSTRRTADC
jgi:hypothetical protein